MKRYILFLIIGIKLYSFNISTYNFPPYSYKEDGKIKGITSQILALIYEELEQNYKIKLLKRDTLTYQLDYINTLAYPITRTPYNYDDYYYVGPIMKVNYYFIGLRGLKEIDEDEKLSSYRLKKIAVLDGSEVEDYLRDKVFKNLYALNKAEQLIDGLYKGSYDMIAYDYESFRYLSHQLGYDIELTARYFDLDDISTYLYFAITKGSDELKVEKFRNAFNEIQKKKLLNATIHEYFQNTNYP